MNIISLESSNVKRIKAIRIEPDGKPLVIVGGSNGSGKSSTLDSIYYALGGKGTLPPKPVRDGQDEATITLDLGEYTVERIITPDGKSTLKVTGKDGGRYPSPQAMLDSLVGDLSFDPLEFSRMDPKAQVETLKALVGLDFSSLDRQKSAKSEERLLIGREVKALEGQLAGMRQHAGAPTAEVSISELTLELNKAKTLNADADASDRDLKASIERIVTIEQTIIEAEESLEKLRARLAYAKADNAKWQAMSEGAKRIDESVILSRMSECETTNRKVRDNRERRNIATKANAKQTAYDALSAELSGIDAQKAQALAEAKFPVPGLSFDETGVLVAGMPFQQASSAEQLRVSVAMGLALNPKLKVLLVRDGSLLDDRSLALVSAMAAEAGAQIWLEKVSTGAECSVVIEDGLVRQ